MTGEEIGFFMEKTLKLGAKEVFFQPVFMKKNRPGVKITMIISPEELELFSDVIFNNSTTIGFRFIRMGKEVFPSSEEKTRLELGYIGKKTATRGKFEKFKYEYDDLKAIALKECISLSQVAERIEKELKIQEVKNR